MDMRIQSIMSQLDDLVEERSVSEELTEKPTEEEPRQ